MLPAHTISSTHKDKGYYQAHAHNKLPVSWQSLTRSISKTAKVIFTRSNPLNLKIYILNYN